MTTVLARVPEVHAVRRQVPAVAVTARPPARPAAPAATSARLRLTMRGRVVVALLTAVLCAGGALGFGAVADASSPGHGVQVVRHTVVSGETLWAVARSVARPGEDVRDVVAEIERLNGMRSSALQAGQTLWLPDARVSGR